MRAVADPNEARFYWQSSAAGLLLGMGLGLLTGIVIAVSVARGVSYAEDVGVVMALPLVGILVGALCGGAAGIAGSVYTSRVGRLPPFLLTVPAAVAPAALVGAVFSGFTAQWWATGAAVALLPAVILGLLLPRVSERFRRSA